MSNLLTNVRRSKWITPGSDSAEQNNLNLHVNYPFDEVKAVLIECIKHYAPIPWNYLRSTQNLDFGDLIELHSTLFKNFNIHYIQHSLFKEISYRIYYLKDDIERNLIWQLEPFDYSSLQETKKTVVTTLEQLQGEFLTFKVGTIRGTSWGTHRKEVYESFNVKIDIYKELLRKTDFYLTYNHLNPDNPNQKDWPQYISETSHTVFLEEKTEVVTTLLVDTEKQAKGKSIAILGKGSPNKVKDLSNHAKIKTNKTFSELKAIFEIVFDYEKLKTFLPNPELFNSESIYINPKYLDDFIYRIFDLGNSDYDDAPNLAYTGLYIDQGFLCVWASFLRDLIDLEEALARGSINNYLTIISSKRNKGKSKWSLSGFKKHFIGLKWRNALEKEGKRIPIKKLLESIK